MTTIDRDLAGALKLARTKPMHFTLVIKAADEGTLIVSKKPIPIGAIAEAKRDLGGGKIVKGRCLGGASGGLVFETAKEPDPSVGKTIKAVIRRDAGLTLKIETRRASDLVDDDDGAQPDPADAKAIGKQRDEITRLGQEIERSQALRKGLPAKYDRLDQGQQEKGLGQWAKGKGLDRFPRFLMAVDWGRDAKFIVEEFLRDGAPSAVSAKLQAATRNAILQAHGLGQKPGFDAARKEIVRLVDTSMMPAYVKDTQKGIDEHVKRLRTEQKAAEGKLTRLGGG